ncbi:uncharacterized protein ISCGN_031742 [Ixodes scapularis]
MALFGQVEPFDDTKCDWLSYEERLRAFLRANGVADANRVDVVISLRGADTYKLLKTLVAPEDPALKSFEDVLAVLRNHLSPRPSVIAERATFHKREQQEGESVGKYVAELKRMTQTCNFGSNLEETLRDRFVSGLSRVDIQRVLFAEDESLTFKKAVEKALTIERATMNVQACHNKADNDQLELQKLTAVKPKAVVGAQDKCFRCGSPKHIASSCPHRNAICYRCNREGHFQRFCKASLANTPGRAKQFRNFSAEEEKSEAIYGLQDRNMNAPFYYTLKVGNAPLQMELDTGAAVSIISKRQFQSLFPRTELSPASLILRTYTGERVKPKGVATVDVEYRDFKGKLPLHVLGEDGPPLIGRDWVYKLKFDLGSLNAVSVDVKASLQDILIRYQDVFKDELGCMRGEEARLSLREGASPKFLKARSMPFALKPAVEEELKRLEVTGVIEAVAHSDYATPVVPVLKKDGSVRLCGDYKTTVNPCLDVEQYPLPRLEDILATVAGATVFSKIDLSRAYQQVPVHPESQPYLTINTHKGLFRVKRLAFGIASAPALFQKIMDSLLAGIQGVTCYLDDILVTGKTAGDHLKNLEQVLKKLSDKGVRVKKEKCEFLKASLKFLGHQVGEQGVAVLAENVQAILDAPQPQDSKQLRSFLGMVTFYGKFLPDLSTTIAPLNELLRKDVVWTWSKRCQDAFNMVKRLLVDAPVLAHYDPKADLQVSCDASAYGLGAVLSRVYSNGDTRPIAFASRTLTSSEKNYSQLEKEALAIVFGVKKFHIYLFGRSFVLVTDHEPLQTILGPKTGIPSIAAARLQRWAITLSAYQYRLVYRPGRLNVEADCLSRLPVPGFQDEDYEDDVAAFLSLRLQSFPVSSQEIAQFTAKDKELCQVARFLAGAWPAKVEDCLKRYSARRSELTWHQNCLLWGMRVVIPKGLRERVLDELHEGHPGIVRMKELARSYVWWPEVDADIEYRVRSCDTCQQQQSLPGPAPLHPWSWPTRPWQRLHLDFAGPFQGRHFLVSVDSHSKWPEVFVMNSTSAEATIEKLRELFSHFGLPDVVVSDNGPQFCSQEFQIFLRENGVRHVRTAPYHPSSNGLAERFIRTLKEALRKEMPGRPLSRRLASFLLAYRNTPHATTLQSPAELLLGRRLTTRLDRLRPSAEETVHRKQDVLQVKHSGKHRHFVPGDKVYVKNFRPGERWLHGVVMARSGPVSYRLRVTTPRGTFVWRRHQDHLRLRESSTPEEEEGGLLIPSVLPSSPTPGQGGLGNELPPVGSPVVEGQDMRSTPVSGRSPAQPQEIQRRYPERQRRAPNRFSP